MDMADARILDQHLIDPEICIRCNTCEATCPIDAITHDDNNYVVDPDKCNHCMDCITPCPTGSIDNWRKVVRVKAYTVEEQLGWDALPEQEEIEDSELADAPADSKADVLEAASASLAVEAAASAPAATVTSRINSTMPPWSAAHAYANLYGPKAGDKSITATVTGNFRVTEVGREYDTHHIVLDFGKMPFPVLEGQSIAVVPPGTDDKGKPHHPRQYSIASARNGERPGYNNVSLTIKRVLEDYDGKPVRGVASNYMCDLKVGDKVEIIGPFGTSFLMPNHPRSNIVMICTGTGSAPMRAMTEWRRRLRASGKFDGGKLMLFFGARTQADLPYFGPLQKLPKDFIDINFAFSREQDKPKRYVQDAMRERAADLAPLILDSNTCFYVCGLKAMEEGVLLAMADIVEGAGHDWTTVAQELKREARIHLETY